MKDTQGRLSDELRVQRMKSQSGCQTGAELVQMKERENLRE